MNRELTEMVFILDRSGSMHGLEESTIAGFNDMIAKQQQMPGTALVSTVLFDDESVVIHDRMDLRLVPQLTPEEYYVRGCTALLDAVGGAVRHIGNIHKYARSEDVPGQTLFVITTDGLENASRTFSGPQVKKMVERQTKRYGWEFLFLGANIDAALAAESIGIRRDRAVEYLADTEGTTLNFAVMSNAASCMRKAGFVADSWSDAVKEDHKRRRRR